MTILVGGLPVGESLHFMALNDTAPAQISKPLAAAAVRLRQNPQSGLA